MTSKVLIPKQESSSMAREGAKHQWDVTLSCARFCLVKGETHCRTKKINIDNISRVTDNFGH